MADGFVLRNGGDFVLRNGGDQILRNPDPVEIPGVTLEGQHATVDLRGTGRRKKRVLVYTLEANARVSRNNTLSTTARLQKITEHTAKARISRITEGNSLAKLTRLYSKVAKAHVYDIVPEGEKKVKDVRDKNSDTIHYIKEAKKDKIRKLYDEYKEEFD